MNITDEDREAARKIGLTTDEGMEKAQAIAQTLDLLIQEEAVNAHKNLMALGISPKTALSVVCRQVDLTSKEIQSAGMAFELMSILRGKSPDVS